MNTKNLVCKLIKSSLMGGLCLLAGCSTGPQVRGDALAPVNVSPAANSELLQGSQVEFVWQAALNATHYDFHVYNKTDGSIVALRKRLDSRHICDESVCRHVTTLNLPVHPGHSWRVRSVNYRGVSPWNRSFFDAVGSFSNATAAVTGTGRPPPQSPAIVSPAGEVVVSAKGKVTFRWVAAAGATVYDFNVFNVVDGNYVNRKTDIPVSTVCEQDSCAITADLDLPASPKHVWRLRAGNAAGKSKWSRGRFETM